MEVDCTDSPRPTRRRATRVWLLDTSLALANVSLLTVRVNDTFRFTSGDGVRVGDQAGLTSTDGVACPGHRALSPRATGRWVTRVGLDDTPLALANVCLLAVGVYNALRAAASDGVRLGDEARLTGANGIA